MLNFVICDDNQNMLNKLNSGNYDLRELTYSLRFIVKNIWKNSLHWTSVIRYNLR